ncbi:MAG: type II toxin-antitoxin system VapB family antitoxin [Ignavibacteria bacterium]|nr:type II toxin-antitoxin system VapB family antitoxin [Ignavibacteria bacterium]MBP7094093.1 type II toxin-antitoxin system VapB family antitoxin [Candidatus Kapabacteria bacterium]MBK6420472.1 type II toxin-antitoxin system VapB family antitoxin [Ignavibacteria bacterium]MBK6761574.1 type II toxin-antitoxin system VapB family antitoxin [Ignavibacteria bacterium]MBK7033598.1 type II toxin-antitoxin system VapB family antitoxin [Ignavibacteria bacterium]
MRTSLHIDEKLLEKARRLSGISDHSTLIHTALASLIERESLRQLASLKGSEPQLTEVPRRRA